MKLTKLSKSALCVAVPTVAAVPVALTGCDAGKTRSEKPNVIFILMDDAGYGDFSCYGQTRTETPNIDALAESGILFTDMYTNCPVSAPSRGCLMTGLHMGHTQIRDNVNLGGTPHEVSWEYDVIDSQPEIEGQMGLEPGTPTLATKMKEAGYATGMVGKWGLGGPLGESAPWKMGFDFYYGCICQRLAHNYYPPYLWKNDKKEYINDIATSLRPGTKFDEGADPYDLKSYEKYSKGKTYAPDKMCENVIEFVNENKDKPFFLMWTTPYPHSALMAPQEWVDKYVAKYGDEEPITDEKCSTTSFPHNYYPCRYPHATYSAMISYFDHQVGQLVEELKRLGIYENTLIIITSDNGPANNASSPTVWMDSAAPYRCGKGWGKRTLHEGGIRMPFVASWPAKMRGGAVSNHVGYFADVMPTLCELVGVESPKTDGISLLPTLSGDADVQKQHEYLYWEFPDGGGQLAVRWGNWKGLVKNVHAGNRTMQLFDISTPGKDIEKPEMDVAAEHPEIVERMWQYIEQSHVHPTLPKFQIDITRK
ncbi:MAG: arylsulfatase [Alistipes sp.]|nr:arylsulfatase [Alistipes sp.]